VLVIETGRALQAGPIDTVYEHPATMRVAELLGLHNVGEGVMREEGVLEIGDGLRVKTAATAAQSITAGQRVMWRVSSHALVAAPDGPYLGTIDAIELRRGERYIRVEIGGAYFDIASEDIRLRHGSQHRFAIASAGVSVWGAQAAQA
jgi:ABC-type Fe3+/spermidine/putrescine transport system ATPase subunit